MIVSEKPQSITFTKTLDDYKAAQRLRLKWDAKKWSVVGAASAIMLGAGAASWFDQLPGSLNSVAWIATGACFGAWIGGLATRFVFSPMAWRKTFSTSKLLRSPSTYTWDSRELRTSNQFGNSVIPWGSFFKVKRNEEMLLLYIARNQFLAIPRRAFSDDASFTSLGELADRMIAADAA